MFPETLRLADYDLGHDERAQQHQPVREHFGERFYDWQRAQDADESWRECELHARNLLGAEGFAALQRRLAGEESDELDAGSGKSSGTDSTLLPVRASPLFDHLNNE